MHYCPRQQNHFLHNRYLHNFVPLHDCRCVITSCLLVGKRYLQCLSFNPYRLKIRGFQWCVRFLREHQIQMKGVQKQLPPTHNVSTIVLRYLEESVMEFVTAVNVGMLNHTTTSHVFCVIHRKLWQYLQQICNEQKWVTAHILVLGLLQLC